MFLPPPVWRSLRLSCSVAELQLLLCGVATIDVDDWQASTKYEGMLNAQSDVVVWFWAAVRSMTPEERAALLHFCTGSTRAPATGFVALMGYGGQQHRFTLQGLAHEDEGRLPTAATCFNTLRLPLYQSPAALVEKLRLAVGASAGFDEEAVE